MDCKIISERRGQAKEEPLEYLQLIYAKRMNAWEMMSSYQFPSIFLSYICGKKKELLVFTALLCTDKFAQGENNEG